MTDKESYTYKTVAAIVDPTDKEAFDNVQDLLAKLSIGWEIVSAVGAGPTVHYILKPPSTKEVGHQKDTK
jgi:hypothetical protein